MRIEDQPAQETKFIFSVQIILPSLTPSWLRTSDKNENMRRSEFSGENLMSRAQAWKAYTTCNTIKQIHLCCCCFSCHECARVRVCECAVQQAAAATVSSEATICCCSAKALTLGACRR